MERVYELALQVADEAARELLECELTYQPSDDACPTWLRLPAHPGTALAPLWDEITRCATYLELRGQLEFNDIRTLVRFTDLPR